MSFNLIRNSRVFFTTNVNPATGVVQATGFTAGNTREIQVLEGFTFSQNTTQETVTLNEAGETPVRGQRSFNTALDPVDFSFSTYMRPSDLGTGNNVTCEESVLWNAMFSDKAIGVSGAAWTEGEALTTCVATNSNKHQLQQFGLIITVDTTTFVIDNCVLNTATIDFGIDAIAMVQWAGQGSLLRQITTPTLGVDGQTGNVTFSGTLGGVAKKKDVNALFLANKLSTVVLDEGINSGGTAYTIALTGGTLTISNNVTYLTPANLAVVNKPITYFAGTRSISGSLNCYLRTGSANSAGLMNSLLVGSSSEVDPDFYMKIVVGGAIGAATRVEFEMPAVVLSIPTVNAEQVVSTTINFTAQGSSGNNFDIGQSNEITINYLSAQTS
jgi:hypothetical protein